MSSARAKVTKPGTRFKFSEATTNAFEREEANYFALWRSQNPAGVKYGDLPKAQRDGLTNGRWEAVNRLIELSCVQEDIVNSEGTVDEWKTAIMKRFTRRHEKLVKPSSALVPAIPPKVLDRLVDGLLDTTSGRKLFREKEAISIDQRRAEIQGRDGVTNASIGARAVAEARLWADLTEERKAWYHNAAQSHNEGSHADLADLLSQLTGGIRKRYDPCLLTLVCTIADSSGQAQTIVVNSVPDSVDSSTGTIEHALEEHLHCSIAVIANEKAKEVFKSLQQGEPVPKFLGEANEMDSSLSFAIGEVAEYFSAVWAHTFGEQAIPWSNIEDYFDKQKWAFPGGLKDPTLYDSWGALSPMLAYLREYCGPFAIPAFEFSSQPAPSHDIPYDSIPCFISNVSEKNSTLREALGEVNDFLAVLWGHASLEGHIHWDDIDSFYDTTRWSFPGGATDPTVACKSWASLRKYLDFLRANCGPDVPNRFHFDTRLPRPSEHLDESDPKTPSQSSFSDHATVEEDGNGLDESEDAERSCDEMDMDIEDLFDNGTYIGHDRKSDTSSDDSEPEEPVENDAAEPEIVEPGVTERDYEEPKTGGRKRKHEPLIPDVNQYDEEPPKKAKRRPGRPKAMVTPATIPDPDERKGRKKASRTTKINGARYAETTSPPRHFVPKVLETRLRNRASAKQA